MVLLLTSCGEMGMMFSSGTSGYEVSAYVNDKIIKNYSIVESGDHIRPAFLHHISGDPDITGLQVLINDSAGNIIGDARHYSMLGRNESGNRGVFSPINDLNEDFSDFPLPEDLSEGQYTLIFNVLGGSDILHQSTQTMYYISDSNFSVDDLRVYMPNKSEGPQLIPLGTTILLEAAVKADAVFDPYIIWYHGDEVIAEGTLSERYHHLLWTVPETEGFPKIKVEVFPCLPDTKAASDARGLEKELSLPVSAKKVAPRGVEENLGDTLYWYQFAGNLEAEDSAIKNDAVLVQTQQNPPRWEPFSNIYGLVIGEEDSYGIPDFAVSLNNENDTEYDFYSLSMRFSPKNIGTLFRASFNTADSSLSSLDIEVLLEENELILSLRNGSDLYRKSISADLLTEKNLVMTNLNFYAFKNQFLAYLELQDSLSSPLSTEHIIIPYSGVLSGDGTFVFGVKQQIEQEITLDETDLEIIGDDIAIVDEFLLLQSRKIVEF
jgi:hypothetical protein